MYQYSISSSQLDSAFDIGIYIPYDNVVVVDGLNLDRFITIDMRKNNNLSTVIQFGFDDRNASDQYMPIYYRKYRGSWSNWYKIGVSKITQ